MGSILIIAFLVFSGLMIIIPSNIKISSANEAPSSTDEVDNDFKNGTMSNLTIVGYGKNSELILNFSENASWINVSPPISPSLRGYHTMAPIYGTDNIVLFGGWFSGNTNNETWVYDFSNNTWTQKFPINSPSSREDHAMASVYNDDKVIIFGGGLGVYDDTWVYDLSNNTWTQKMPTIKPSARGDHEMATIWGTDQVMLFGGGGGPPVGDKTWIFDLSNETWTNMSPLGSKPTARHDHTMASVYGTDKVLLFGGMVGSSVSNETWVYDFSDNNWTKKTPAVKPNARWLHSMASIWGTDKFVIFSGGIRFAYDCFNDTWVYDLSNNTWTNITTSIKPTRRWDHKLSSVYGRDEVVLFGGSGTKNDTWIYKYLEFMNNGTYISMPYNTGSDSSLKTICWNASVTKNTNIEFQLRAADSKLELNTKPFVGFDGTPKSYYTSSPSDIWLGHNNKPWVQYKAYFYTNTYVETPRLKNVTITFNYWPNTTLIDPNNGSIKVDNKPTFEWNFTDRDSKNQSAFQVLIDNQPDFESIDFDSDEQNSNISTWQFPNGTSYTALPDGTWYWKARTKDNDDTWGLYSSPWKLIIDTRPPNSTISSPMSNKAYFNVNTISGIASDPINGSGLDRIEITIQRISDNNYWSGISWILNETWLLSSGISNWVYDSAVVEWASGNQYRVRSRAIDNATNVETPTSGNVFTIDQDRPISNIDYPADNSYLNDLDIITGSAFDIKDYGIKSVEISIKRFGDSTYWTGTNWVATKKWLLTSGNNSWSYDTSPIPWTSGALYWIQSRAIDKASNMEIPGMGIRFYIDMANPNSEIEIPLNNSFVNNLKEISGTAVDVGGAGIYSVEICIKQFNASIYWGGIGWTFDETWLDVKGTERWIFNSSAIDWKTDTNYAIRSRAMDNANNIEYPGASVTFMYDDTPPVHSVIINNDDEFTRNHNVELSLHAEDSGSGISMMAVSANGQSWMNWELYNSTKSCTLPTGDGVKEVYLKVQDRAGNIAEPAIDTIILDTTPPEKRSVVINDNAKLTRSEPVLLTQTASDSLSGINKMSFSCDGKTWTPAEPFNNKKSMNLPTGDGEKTVYLKVNDNAGNSAIASDSIVLDSTPPHSLTITIISMDSDSDSRIITLNLQALDNLSGVDEMAFSFDGFTWTDWEPFNQERTFTLIPSNQAKIIYFKVSDKAGNVASPVSTSITKSEAEEPDMDSKFFSQYWFILLIIIIIIIILIIVVIVLKRKKKEVPQEQTEEAVTVKPGTVPDAIIPVGEIQATPKPEQLLETTTTQPSAQPIATPAPLPKLATPATPGQVPESQQIPQTARVPQLPSATTDVEAKPTIAKELKE